METLELEEVRQKLDEKIAERDKLKEKLDHSLTIKSLWNEAFEFGSVTSKITGSMNTPSEYIFHINRSDGESRSFNILQIPPELINEETVRNWIHNARNRKCERLLKAWKGIK